MKHPNEKQLRRQRKAFAKQPQTMPRRSVYQARAHEMCQAMAKASGNVEGKEPTLIKEAIETNEVSILGTRVSTVFRRRTGLKLNIATDDKYSLASDDKHL